MNFVDFGIRINKNGSNQQKLHCPQCTPTRKNKRDKSLSVKINEGIWKCHNCGWTGTINEKREKQMKVYQKPSYRKPTVEEKTAIYLEDRGISCETQLKYEVSCEKAWLPQTGKEENCIVFNYFIDGELINRKYRDGAKNMKMEKDCRLVMYNPIKDHFKKSVDTIYITEGEIDALTLIELGYENVLSVPNGAPSENTDLNNLDLSYLETIEEIYTDYSEVILVMDADKVGGRFRDEIARRIGHEMTAKVKYPDGCKDINDVLIKHGRNAVFDCIENKKQYPVKGLYNADFFTESVLNYYHHGFEKGAETGWMDVDKIYRPRQREFTILTGIPSHGKSAWLDNLMLNIAAMSKWKFMVYSPENAPCERHIATLAEIIVGKPFSKDYSGYMSEGELQEALGIINKIFNFVVPEEEGFTMDGILKLAKAAVKRYGVKGIIIDPWNEIEQNRGSMSETDFISKCLTKLRYFCRTNNVHAWVVAHPTKLQKDKKTGEYPIPTPYDISGSSHWRNKADNCVCVYRDFNQKVTFILSQKARFKECGEVGDAILKYDIKNSRYRELSNQEKQTIIQD